MQMSEAAKRALTNAKDWNQGTVIDPDTNLFVALELINAKMIGKNGGLTRKGSIAAERLQRAQLDELFGKL